MAHKYAEITFTPTVKKIQSEKNSRNSYAKMEDGPDFNHLIGEREQAFIAERDSFYMASVSETNWPYVQHRGGPKGFLKTLGPQTLGFADYRGNKQYISTGNFRRNDRVSLFLMDYVNRARLKILGHMEEIPASDVETLSKLEDNTYRATIERGFLIHVSAFDWNCPQHITPRYTEEDIEKAISHITAENEQLKKQLADLNSEA